MRTRPPVPSCRGTRPSQAANSRPDLKAAGSPIAAMTAVAVRTPTPGISATRLLSALVAVPYADPPLDLGDLLVEPADPRPLLAKRVDHHRRQTLGDPLQGLGHASAHAGPALRHHLAVFGQKTRAAR